MYIHVASSSINTFKDVLGDESKVLNGTKQQEMFRRILSFSDYRSCKSEVFL